MIIKIEFQHQAFFARFGTIAPSIESIRAVIKEAVKTMGGAHNIRFGRSLKDVYVPRNRIHYVKCRRADGLPMVLQVHIDGAKQFIRGGEYL